MVGFQNQFRILESHRIFLSHCLQNNIRLQIKPKEEEEKIKNVLA